MSRYERNIPDFVLDNLDNLKNDALSKGYSIRDLGRLTGSHPNFIGGLGLGRFTPTRSNYNKLAAVLHWKEWQ